MPTMTGTVQDITGTSMATLTATLIFWPQVPTTAGSIIMPTQEVSVAVGGGGVYSVELRSTEINSPNLPYAFRVEWFDAGGNFNHVDNISADHGIYLRVPTSGGRVTDNLTKTIGNTSYLRPAPLTQEEVDAALARTLPGSIADNPSVVAAGVQAAKDALANADILVGNETRSPKFGRVDDARFVDKNGKVALSVNSDGSTTVGDTTLIASAGHRWVDADGFIAGEITPDGRWHIYDPAFSTGGGTSPGVANVSTLHVILAVGQSNMAGQGLPVGGGLDSPDPRIFQYGANRRVLEPATVPLDMHRVSEGISPATTFAREYLKTQPSNVGVLIIPAAHGATGFTGAPDTLTWTPNAASALEYDLPKLAVTQTLEGIAAARAAGYVAELKTILWHQGENNHTSATTTYATVQDSLIAYLRSGLSTPTLPFVVGQMCPEGMDVTPTKLNIDKAHAGTPARVTYTGWATARRDGHNVGDTTHFSRVGMEHLGKTYLAGYFQARGNTPTASPSPAVAVTATKTGTTVTVTWKAPPATVTASQSFDLHGAGARTEWAATPSRITGYKVETKTGPGAWVEITRDAPMTLTEKLTAAGGVTQVRVTAHNGTATAAPVTSTVTGA